MSDVTRRAVLGAGAATVGLAIANCVAGPAAAATGTTPPGPTRAQYEKFIGREFDATRGRQTRRIRLVAVEDLHPTTPAQRPHCYNLIFEAVNDETVRENIYRVARAGVPGSELLLSPAGGGTHVQALVNRAG